MHALSPSKLPPALMELTFLRASSSSSMFCLRGIHSVSRRVPSRKLHNAALATPPHPPLPFRYSPEVDSGRSMVPGRSRTHEGSLAVRSGKPVTDLSSELGKRVQALQEAAAAEETGLTPATYSEEDLMSFYEDILAIPTAEQTNEADPVNVNLQADEDITTITAIDKRFLASAEHGLLNNSQVSNEHTNVDMESSAQLHRRVLFRAHEMVSRLEKVRSSSVSPDASSDFVPVSIMTSRECEALVRVCLQNRDGEAAESALDLLKRTGIPLPANSATEVLELYADSGNATGVDRILANFVTEFPTERQRHLHVKSHIKSNPLDTIPTSALSILHSYEEHARPAPMQTYTSVITSLFSSSSSIARAQAWDLFSHMRYAAHPKPDALLYTLMIRACASPISSSRASEPERALDLWTEMTVDHRIAPTVGTYSAIILACARSGSKSYVNEAFRLAKEMLDSHRDARGQSAFRPDRRTFCALLEGAKRVGDLARARWILAEMVRGNRPGEEADENMDLDVNEEVMMHVFHTYASYRPPFTRSTAVLLSSTEQLAQTQASSTLLNSEEVPPEAPNAEADLPTVNVAPAFTHIPPQSRFEVINEVKSLFKRILGDTGMDVGGPAQDDVFTSDKKFKHVQLSTRLLNSYISVFYKHSSLATARTLFWELFDDLEVPRSPRTYIEALERCTLSGRHDRKLALDFANEIWANWTVAEGSAQSSGRPISGRLVERAHVAMIRMLTLAGDLPGAMSHVRSFVTHYPPSAIRQPTIKPALRSTRTTLVGTRPLVRFTSSTDVPDDHVPPLFTFGDLEVLHHRLVAAEKWSEIGYLKYVCKSYEWALRVRRDEAMKAKPAKQDLHHLPSS